TGAVIAHACVDLALLAVQRLALAGHGCMIEAQDFIAAVGQLRAHFLLRQSHAGVAHPGAAGGNHHVARARAAGTHAGTRPGVRRARAGWTRPVRTASGIAMAQGPERNPARVSFAILAGVALALR